MTTSWSRVEAAFDAALGLTDSTARSAYLARLAAEEPAVAAEVQALLSAENRASRFLGQVGNQARRLEAFTLQPGQCLGRYRIEACLAAGGMGVVYRAWDEQLQRSVALKCLDPGAGPEPGQRQRLLEEARWASRLDHPSVCTVHEVGETEAGLLFIAMALCPGEDLGRRLRRAPLRIEAILRLGLQITEALMAAHAAGVLHRDLKPGNVIVDDAGAARLVDFGIATAPRAATDGRGAAGTLAYMAPEQIDGGELDERCDIWGVGALLFEAITGRRPFPRRDGVPLERLRRLDHTAPPPGSLVPGVPPALDALVQRCLQPEPASRFSHAGELHAALRRLLQQSAPEVLAAAPARDHGHAGLRLGEYSTDAAQRYLTVLAAREADPVRREAVREAIIRFGGQEVEGDSPQLLLAVFGYPVADEHAALRAGRCAETLAAAEGGPLALATGPGWIREAGPGGGAELGGEVCRRARDLLQEGGDRPAMDAATARLTRLPGAFVSATSAVAPAARLTPLIGRVHELGLLQEAWARCLEQEQQAILIGGEPGIGKTRLVRELIRRIPASDGARIIECQASPHQMASPLQPVADYLRGALAGGGQTAAGGSRRLAALLRLHGLAVGDYAAAVARALGLPVPPGVGGELLSPELEKERGLEGLARLLLAAARRQPCLLVLEDLHWADPTTLALLERIWQAASSARLLVVCTHRPEFRPPWSADPGVSQIRLARLRRSEARAMAQAVGAAADGESAATEQLLARCDGIPLFIEELGAVVASGLAPDSGIPWSLQDALLGRLERLGEGKELAQAAAVAGRSVPSGLIERITDLAADTRRAALQALQRSGLMLAEDGTPPGYRFKHALIRDAAYASLGESARRALHRRVAEALADPAAALPATPEQLARHWQAASEPAQAARHWAEAAERALARFAVAEAQDNARQGLALVDELPDGGARTQLELTLCTTLGPALMAAKGYADEEVNDVYSRARRLCTALGDPPAVFPVLFGLWTYHCVRARHVEALELAEALVGLARREGAGELLTEAYMVRGITRYFMGRFPAAETDLADAWAACAGQDRRLHTLRYGQDPAMVIRSYQSWNAWQLGRTAEADALSEDAVAMARDSRHPFSIAYGLTFAAWHALNRQDAGQAHRLLAEAIELCRRHRIQVFLALALALDALRRITAGEGASGLTAMEEALQIYTATGAELFLPAWYAAMAGARAAGGDSARAAALLEQARERCEASGEHWCLAEICRSQATLAAAAGEADSARRWLEEGRTLALQQGASTWLARIEATTAAEKNQ